MMPSNLSLAYWSKTGQVHRHNEDALANVCPAHAGWLAARGRLFVVADGIGGGPHGRFASRFAVDTVQRIYFSDPSPDPIAALKLGIQRANEWLNYWAGFPQYRGMGAAIVAATLRDGELVVAHVGDCRAYLYRARQLYRLTRDHNWGEEMVARGLIDQADAARHPYRNVLVRSLGGERHVPIEVGRFAFYPGDRVALCSDGLVESIGDVGLMAALQRSSAQAAINQARAFIGWRKPGDDTTLVVMDVAIAPMVRNRVGYGLTTPANA
jgi:PPM family protein phosphatase